MEKNEGLKEKSENVDKINNKKTSFLDRFANFRKDKDREKDEKIFIDEKEMASKCTKRTIATYDSTSRDHNNKNLPLFSMNRTSGNFGFENRLPATTKTNGFFNKTSSKFIKNSITINE